MNAETGYGAARVLHARRVAQGWRPLGRKIGFTNRAIWPRYGVQEPIWGMVYDRTLVHAQAGRAAIRLEGLANPRIEPEICLGLKAALPPSADAGSVLSCIEWVAHACEIVQCGNADWKVTLDEATAQNGLHGLLVLGAAIPVRELPDLATRLPAAEVSLSRNGVEVESGKGANVLDSPLNALAHLAALLAGLPQSPPLAAGEMISTGTLTDAYPVEAGQTWSTRFTGLPLQGLAIEFA